MRLPTRRAEKSRQQLQQDPDVHLTPATIERLKRQLEDLIRVQQPGAKLELQCAQEMGDLSENFGYQEAKARLRRINDRILSLQERITHAIPIVQGTDADGRIRIGSTVVVESDGIELKFEVLGSQETSPSHGRISHASPLGMALIGHGVDDAVRIQTPHGEKIYKIIEVK